MKGFAFKIESVSDGVVRKVANQQNHRNDQEKTEIERRTIPTMVLNGSVVVMVADISANLCQYLACNPERIRSDRVLYLLFCFPFQQFHRLAIHLWSLITFHSNNTANLSDEDDVDDSHSD
ncbi:hypothetical protein HS088_TW23G00447 [Tripterygium wilfordii]|uniref:Uncharacterized protein n=1 Tax=Tripterygium wilfordii TaxID=458696 RepID=A0A7J7BV03_TRIWF|nr:hypothetical protein HS088_TW23G00447 [Tripterygium wilfordii]